MDTCRQMAECQMELLFGHLDNNSYLAHISPGKKPEILKEHAEKVVEYACLSIEKHGLEEVVGELVADIAGNHGKTYRYWLKRMFVAVFVFHDAGKVNENFQVKRMLNPIFKSRRMEVLCPPHGHSFLGSWLFLYFLLDQVCEEAELTDDEKKSLFVYAFFFSFVVKHHHSSVLTDAGGEVFMGSFAGCYDELKDFLTLWGYSGDFQRIEAVFKHITLIQKETEKSRNASFALYALIKLCSSLLTAADYLATHEYMYGNRVDDMGVFDNRERIDEIVNHLRTYRHNRSVYGRLGDFSFEYPAEKSGENLNRLRTGMAVEVIRTIREHRDQRLFYIEAPTGGGKTNLSMIAVTELMAVHPDICKVFYVFPFTTLITQTYQVMKKAMGLTVSELAEIHSKASFGGEDEEKQDGLYNDRKQDYIDRLFGLYPVSVLSHVKFFDILKSNGKEANYLFHRLANSVIVIDELQTYNPLLWDKMYYMIGEYARLFNVRFILMSATLPKIGKLNVSLPEKTEFVDLLPNARKYITNPNFAQRVKFRFDLFREKLDISGLADCVIACSREYAQSKSAYGTVHTIIEFIYKKTASAFYACIRERTSFFDAVLVLSGTVLESRRREVINYLKNPVNRTKNILLITTQVVEAGVDIDMDLGFKNSSLVDSDEQLAGRVNRNALKYDCEVYLFRLDEAKVLYGNDKRYQAMRECITPDDYERILNEKEFSRLYELVFKEIDTVNRSEWIRNFDSEFKIPIEQLDYSKVDKSFKIIDQQNVAVFVPLFIPLEIDSETEGEKEKLFSAMELEFLRGFSVVPEGGQLDGRKVWEVYEQLVDGGRTKEFSLERQIDFKVIQRIMGWFTFSLMLYAKELQELRCGMGEDKLGYFYFSHWNEEGVNGVPYDYKMGLNTRAFKDIAFI